MVQIRQYLEEFWRTDEAQDLVEYTMIVAVFVLGCFSIIGIFMPSVKGIWSQSGSELTSANTFSS
ncbi:MAG: hypothetical protein WCB12_24180 [Bryobacteraceae bacterium]